MMNLSANQQRIMETINEAPDKTISVGELPSITDDYEALIELSLIHSVMLQTCYGASGKSEFGFRISSVGNDFMKEIE